MTPTTLSVPHRASGKTHSQLSHCARAAAMDSRSPEDLESGERSVVDARALRRGRSCPRPPPPALRDRLGVNQRLLHCRDDSSPACRPQRPGLMGRDHLRGSLSTAVALPILLTAHRRPGTDPWGSIAASMGTRLSAASTPSRACRSGSAGSLTWCRCDVAGRAPCRRRSHRRGWCPDSPHLAATRTLSGHWPPGRATRFRQPVVAGRLGRLGRPTRRHAAPLRAVGGRDLRRRAAEDPTRISRRADPVGAGIARYAGCGRASGDVPLARAERFGSRNAGGAERRRTNRHWRRTVPTLRPIVVGHDASSD